jgi:hypothetical protein
MIPKKYRSSQRPSLVLLKKGNEPEQQHRAYERRNKAAYNSAPDADSQQAESPASDSGANNTYQEVYKKTEASASHQFTCQPTGDNAYNNPP